MASYRDFLNKSWGAGAQSTGARAAAWRRQNPPTPAVKPVIQPTPAPAAQPNVSFTPGSLDVAGSQNKGTLDFNYKAGQNSENMNYAQQMGELDAQRPLLDQARDKGYQGADNNSAGRGVFHSGIREQARTDVGADYDKNIRDLARQRLNAANRHQLNVDTSQGQYNIDSSNNVIDSNLRQKTAFESANPVVVPPAPAAPTLPAGKPKVRYTDWLNGRTSTAAMAAAWRKSQGM